MCFELDSTPPIAPIAGAAVDSEDITLTASDGNRFAAFVARADVAGDRPFPAIVILPDVRGLYRFYEELALRFAEQGVDAVAIDYFGRTAGVSKRDDEFPFRDHVAQTTMDGVTADTRAAIRYLREVPGGSQRPVFVTGFCFGGSNAWHQAAAGHGLAGAIGFYGHPNREGFPQNARPVIERVNEIKCPILCLMGGADQGIPREEVDRFDEALTAAGKPHEVVVYDGAPHSFFDRRWEEHQQASDDAWQRSLDFIRTHAGARVG